MKEISKLCIFIHNIGVGGFIIELVHVRLGLTNYICVSLSSFATKARPTANEIFLYYSL